MDTGRGALFVLPSSRSGQRGPVAGWVSTAGWAAAAQRLLGEARILTVDGVLTPEEARARGSSPQLTATRRSLLRRLVPKTVGVARDDIRRFRAVRTLTGAAQDDPCPFRPALLWERHELFPGPGASLARRWGCPFVVFVAAPQVWEGRRWGVRRPIWGTLLERIVERRHLQAADLVVCTSEEVREAVCDLGVTATKLLVAPSGVDLDVFRPVSGAEVSTRYGLDARFVVGWVGSFRRFHGLEVLVDAARRLQSEIPHLTLLLVGDGVHRHMVEQLAAGAGVHAVFPGTVPQHDVPRYLAAMDVATLVAPAAGNFHYSPIKLAEYLACGLPVVAPRIGEVARTVVDGQEALLVSPGDAGALASAIASLHGDGAMRSRLGAAGRRAARSRLSWDAQLARVLDRVGVPPSGLASAR